MSPTFMFKKVHLHQLF
uniref:Uncharacterized protein n=1 Tax=Rhizophora mucronata TaxID=61149 RepID=A0A2P2J0L3_RHIMU